MSDARIATVGRHLRQRGEGARGPLEEPSKICTADLADQPGANLIFAATKRSPDPEPAAGLGIKRAMRQTKAKTARASGTPIHGLALGVSGAGNVHAGRDCCEKQAGTGEKSTPHRIRTCNLRGVPREASPSRLASLNRPDGRWEAGILPAGRDCCEKRAGTGEGSTPHRIRTCNLRFRRPMLYPIELGVLVRHNDTPFPVRLQAELQESVIVDVKSLR